MQQYLQVIRQFLRNNVMRKYLSFMHFISIQINYIQKLDVSALSIELLVYQIISIFIKKSCIIYI